MKARVNLGCGLNAPENWINFDSSLRVAIDRIPLLHLVGFKRRFPQNVRRFDVRAGLPFADASVEYLYSSHMIEHIEYEEGRRLVREVFRVLSPGGRVRFVTPDLHEAVMNYLGRRENTDTRAAASVHFIQSLGMRDASSSGGLLTSFLSHWRQKNLHKVIYDADSLSHLFEEAGFQKIEARNDWIGNFPDLDLLEPPDRRKGSICLEAVTS